MESLKVSFKFRGGSQWQTFRVNSLNVESGMYILDVKHDTHDGMVSSLWRTSIVCDFVVAMSVESVGGE